MLQVKPSLLKWVLNKRHLQERIVKAKKTMRLQ